MPSAEMWMELEAVIQSEVSKKEKQISYSNTYMWNLEQWKLLLFICSIMTNCFATSWTLAHVATVHGVAESDMTEVTYHTRTVARQAPLSMGFSRQEY